jgi:hypothetical protein
MSSERGQGGLLADYWRRGGETDEAGSITPDL